MANPFLDRPDDVPAELPEPYGSFLAFLSDMWEQADQMRGQIGDSLVLLDVIDELQARIVALALMVETAGRINVKPPRR